MTGAEVAIAAVAVSAAGAIASGVATYQAGKAQARAAERNARLAREKAKLDADRQRREARLRQGQIRANVGANGMTVAGTALDLIADSAMEEELDALIIEHNGSMQAAQFQDRANAASAEGRNALIGGVFQGASTFLGSSDVQTAFGE